MTMTILLLPGLASDGTLWRAQVPALRRHGRVHVSDVHARCTALPEMAATLLAEHDGPLVLVGTSMGGILALEAWQRAPQRVLAMALLGSTARADPPEMIKLRSNAIELIEQGRMDELLRANVPFALHPRHARDPALVADYLAMVQRAGADQLVRQNRAIMARPDRRPQLPLVRCPVLVACGADDLLTPPEQSEEIARAVPGAQFEVLPECGHLLTLEQPERVNALLEQWLAGPVAAACAQVRPGSHRGPAHP